MEKNNLHFLKRRDVESGTMLFQEVVTRNSLNHIVPKSDNKRKLSEMGSKNFWLAPWMAKTEEIWVILTEGRLWNTYYQPDEDTMSGVLVNNLKDSDIKIEGVDNIEDIILGLDEDNEEELPISLKYLVAELSFSQCIDIENGFAKMKEFDLNLKEVGDKIYLPMNYEETVQSMAYQMFDSMKKEIMLLAKERKDIEHAEYLERKKAIEKNIKNDSSFSF